MPDTLVDVDILRAAVQLASRARSLHNSQPWQRVAEDVGLHLYVDRSRNLPSTDKAGREAYIGCGAMLDHLCVAMAAAGWTTNVDRFPDPNNPGHLASLDFSPMGRVTDQHATGPTQLGTVAPTGFPSPHRGTGRPSNLCCATPSMLGRSSRRDSRGEALGTGEGVTTHRIAAALRFLVYTELSWWTGHFENSDGIPRSSLLSAAESDRVDVGRTFPVSAHNERPVGTGQDQSTVLVLSTDEDTRDDALRCGEALSAVLLECTLAGMATCTLSHLTELPSSRHLIGTLTGRAAMPQLVIRVGEARVLGELPPITPRRPLPDILRFHRDAGG